MMLDNVRVLIVEDETLVRNAIRTMVEESGLGFAVTGEAENGLAALEMIEDCNPHIVITDIRMPGMDGIQLAREVNFAYPIIKTIIVSGYNEFAYAKQAMQVGVADYILKPISRQELLESLLKMQVIIQNESTVFKARFAPKSGIGGRELAEIAKVFLKKNYNKNIYLNEMAEQFGYTADYIGKLFKKHYQTTPIKYVTNLRINHAKDMLFNHPDMSIKQVSDFLGYSDQFYFSKVFKNATGVFPSNYKTSKGQAGMQSLEGHTNR